MGIEYKTRTQRMEKTTFQKTWWMATIYYQVSWCQSVWTTLCHVGTSLVERTEQRVPVLGNFSDLISQALLLWFQRPQIPWGPSAWTMMGQKGVKLVATTALCCQKKSTYLRIVLGMTCFPLSPSNEYVSLPISLLADERSLLLLLEWFELVISLLLSIRSDVVVWASGEITFL